MEIVPQHVRWLLPEEPCPCDIFMHFRGQYVMALPAGQPVSFKLLEKLALAKFPNIYIKNRTSPPGTAGPPSAARPRSRRPSPKRARARSRSKSSFMETSARSC